MTTTETAIFGGGCFWCTEAVFQYIKGVISVVPGYAGGNVPNPTYRAVCDGATGHAEVVKIEFDPAIVSYKDLLIIFFNTHNPTTLNRQGHDEGTQYRSIILTTNPEQETTAKAIIAEIQSSYTGGEKVVTTVDPLTTFYEAEEYHHRYFERNPDQMYCQAVIAPKIEKFRARFKELLTEGA